MGDSAIDTIATLHPGVPYFLTIREVIDYFASSAKTAEEAIEKARQYIRDRFYYLEHGSRVDVTPQFEKTVCQRFGEVHSERVLV